MIHFLANFRNPVSLGLIAMAVSAVHAQQLPLPVADLKRTEPVDFAGEIMPILKQNCLACHHEKEAEGGLIMETIESLLRGGDTGHAVVPKDVAASLVFARRNGRRRAVDAARGQHGGSQAVDPRRTRAAEALDRARALGSDVTPSESIDWQPIPESIRTVYAMDVAPDGQLAAIGRGNRVVLVDSINRRRNRSAC